MSRFIMLDKICNFSYGRHILKFQLLLRESQLCTAMKIGSSIGNVVLKSKKDFKELSLTDSVQKSSKYRSDAESRGWLILLQFYFCKEKKSCDVM